MTPHPRNPRPPPVADPLSGSGHVGAEISSLSIHRAPPPPPAELRTSQHLDRGMGYIYIGHQLLETYSFGKTRTLEGVNLHAWADNRAKVWVCPFRTPGSFSTQAIGI